MSWVTVQLSEVADMCLGKMLDAQKNRGTLYPYLRNPNVKWVKFDLSEIKKMPFETHELDRYGLRAGDVLICEGGEAGRAAIWDGSIPDMKIQKAIHRVRAGPRLDNRFLVYRLQYDYFRGVLADYYTGATIKHLTGKDLARYRFPLPPLAEQKRIAAILDQADDLRRKRQRALDRLGQLGQAIFIEMFGDVGNPKKGCRIIPLDQLCDLVRGSSPRPQGDPRFFGGPVPRLMIADISRDGMVVTPRIDSLTKEGAKKSRPMSAGSVVMAVSGAVGLPAILAVDACIHDGFVGFRDLHECVLPDFFYWCLLVNREENRAQGTGAIWVNLTTDQVKRFLIPVPPIESQKNFASLIKNLSDQSKHNQLALQMSDRLFYSLQHRAFRGEL